MATPTRIYAFFFHKQGKEFLAVRGATQWTLPSNRLEQGQSPRDVFRQIAGEYGLSVEGKDHNDPDIPLCSDPQVGAIGHVLDDGRDRLYILMTARVPEDWETTHPRYGMWKDVDPQMSDKYAPLVSRYLFGDHGQLTDGRHWSYRVSGQ